MTRKKFAFLRIVASNSNPKPIDAVKRYGVLVRRAMMMPRNPEPIPSDWPPLEKNYE